MEKIASIGFEMLVKGHQADACLRIQVLVPEQQKAVRQGPGSGLPRLTGLGPGAWLCGFSVSCRETVSSLLVPQGPSELAGCCL